MRNIYRQKSGSVLVETALAIPVFLMVIFSVIELSRAMYVLNTLGIAAQKVADKIAINASKRPAYNLSGFSQYADQVRFPGSVVDSSQFSFDVTNASNGSTVSNGQADSVASTKVIVSIVFPPPGNSSLKIPIFDPGNFIGHPIFGQNGLTLTSSATCFLERSRRPILN